MGVHVDPHQPLGVLLLANRDLIVVVLPHVEAQVGELTFFLGPFFGSSLLGVGTT